VALDDYRSDAATIGMAVVAACRYENQALVDAIAGPDGFRQSEISRQIEMVNLHGVLHRSVAFGRRRSC
jgi:hypothetical protein